MTQSPFAAEVTAELLARLLTVDGRNKCADRATARADKSVRSKTGQGVRIIQNLPTGTPVEYGPEPTALRGD